MTIHVAALHHMHLYTSHVPKLCPSSPPPSSYIDDNDKGIRQVAVLACCKILEQHSSLARGLAGSAGGGRAAPQTFPLGESLLHRDAREFEHH